MARKSKPAIVGYFAVKEGRYRWKATLTNSRGWVVEHPEPLLGSGRRWLLDTGWPLLGGRPGRGKSAGSPGFRSLHEAAEHDGGRVTLVARPAACDPRGIY